MIVVLVVVGGEYETVLKVVGAVGRDIGWCKKEIGVRCGNGKKYI
jgi:hypothetical protein